MKARPNWSYANVMATVAVFVALGGSAYAAATITGKDVRNGSISGLDLRNNSVAGIDVRNRSLRALDFKRSSLPAGLPGAKGDTGPGSAAKGVFVNGTDQPITLKPTDDWTTVAQLHTTTANPGVLMFSGGVEEGSASKTDTATVELRVVHNGHVHPLASRTTIAPDQAEVGLALMLCDELPGAQDAQLQAHTTGADVNIGNRNLELAETVHLP